MRSMIAVQHQDSWRVSGRRLHSSEGFIYYILLYDRRRWSDMDPNGKLFYAKGHERRWNNERGRGEDRWCMQPGPIGPTISPPIRVGVSGIAGGDDNTPSDQQYGTVISCRYQGCPDGGSQWQVGRIWGVQVGVEYCSQTASEVDEGLVPRERQGSGGPWGEKIFRGGGEGNRSNAEGLRFHMEEAETINSCLSYKAKALRFDIRARGRGQGGA